MNQQPWVLENNQLTLYCHVQPGARQNQLSGLYDNCLKVQLKTPPIEGKANKALISYLAKLWGIPKSKISIKRGLSSRRKTLLITDLAEIPSDLSKLSS